MFYCISLCLRKKIEKEKIRNNKIKSSKIFITKFIYINTKNITGKSNKNGGKRKLNEKYKKIIIEGSYK